MTRLSALNFRHEIDAGVMPGVAGATTGRDSAAVAGGGGSVAGNSALANALTALQGDCQVCTQLGQQASPSVRQYLSDNQSKLAALEGTEGIAPDSLNQLDLVDNLFSDFSTEVDVIPDLKDSVGDLQIPLAKLALLEPQFFANRAHPARGVIDKITQLPSSGNYPNKALERRVTGINLSGNSITDDNFMEYLFEQISEYGVGTSKICFEITETGTIFNMVKATNFVNEFRNIGCKFSIDDLGTGLASYSCLRELPVDYMKIDGTFMKNIHENPKDYAMTKSINDLAHFLGQESIAAFAENEEVIEKMREIGIDYLQGWGVGRPAPLTELAKQLESVEK